MSLPRFSIALLILMCLTSSLQAQGLEVYDPQGFSGGYAEGVGGPLGAERLYPWDIQDPWMHGYIQYMPFYGAYKHFRPYNYKDVSAQTQTAAGWGMSPQLPYSQQYWHRYHARATMSHGASSAQESLLNYPQPQMFQRRVDMNNAPQNPNPLGVYPNYAPYPYQSQQFESSPEYQQLPPSGSYKMPPGSMVVPQNDGNMNQPQMAPLPNTQPYSGISYQNQYVSPNGSQQPVLMVP